MALDLSLGTPLAESLKALILPKLDECGWSSGGDAADLSDYIILLLNNGNDESALASELSTDVLNLGPNNPDAQAFARWLFEQLDILTGNSSGGQQAGAGDMETSNAGGNQIESVANNPPSAAQDADMGEASEAPSSIPTGPKAMRNGNGPKQQRDKRMLNQLNKQLDRSDDPLHRIRGTSSTGRINSHSGREPPKGPRNQQMGRGMAHAMSNGRGMNAMMNNMNNMNGMNNMGGMPGMPMQMAQNGGLNTQQQMALLQMYEQQAQMMQQLFSGQPTNAFINPNFQHGNRKPLSERIEKSSKNRNQLPQSSKFSKKDGQDQTMTDNAAPTGSGDAMEVESSRQEPSQTMCRFNLSCSKADCPFAHQTPAAPPGASVDMNETCTFGAACMNKKCAGKHPSPAQRDQHKAEIDCAFFPNCRDQANCPYRHPTAPPCRNGADCKTPDCKFYHSEVMCRYNPCTNKFCKFKHEEGQKRLFQDKVWTAPKNQDGEQEHVSERKFVTDDGQEELIIPGQGNSESSEITAS